MNACKVLFIRSNPVDPDPRVEKSVRTLLESGHEVEVLAWDRGDNYKVKTTYKDCFGNKVKVHKIGIKAQFSAGMKNLVPLINFCYQLWKWLNKNGNGYDVIHAYDLDTGLIARRYAQKNHKKFVYDIADYYIAAHGLSDRRIGKIIKKLENDIINKADAVIICSEQRKEQISGTTPKKLVVIHNTPSDIHVGDSSETNESSQILKLVYVGIFGTSRMIDVIAQTVMERNDCEFHVGGFGGGMEEYFEELSKKSTKIKYYGRIPYEKTLDLEKSCDVVCAIYDPAVPNHRFAAPNKFYEALMLGKPMIMAKNTGMDSYVSMYDIGEVIEYNKDSLNKALDSLLQKRSKWAEMGQRARYLYEKEFSWDVMGKRLIELYKNL